MSSLNIKVQAKGDLENLIKKATEVFQAEGFGALTRIDFHAKMKEKLDQDIPPTVVIGLCHPGVAFEIYKRSTDFLSLLPCNLVVREMSQGNYSVEMIRPTSMMAPLHNAEVNQMMLAMDEKIENLLKTIAQ